MCSRVLVMYGGLIVEEGTVREVFYQPMHPYTWGLLNSIPRKTGEKKKLVPIPGSPPDLIAPPPGCPFAPRCHACMKICLKAMPEYSDLGSEHYSACWLVDKAKFEKGEVQA
jgi:oligopeptide transport system ATP-binding protein